MTTHAPPAPTRRPATPKEHNDPRRHQPPPPRPTARPAARYAFSYDHEVFRGSFPTRDAALAAARKGLADRRLPPEALWVGRRRGDASYGPAHRSNDAAAVLSAFRDRLAADSPDSPAHRALDRAAPADLADLGGALDRVLRDWLDAHPPSPADALPADAVEAISEYPLPLIRHALEDPTRPGEVHMLGIEG